jgi:hypothetical protein
MTSLHEAKHLVNVDSRVSCDCNGCRSDSAESPASEWPGWTDDDTWSTTDVAPPEDEVRLTLDQWIDGEADSFECLATPVAVLVAEELRSLAFRVRLTSSTTPDEFRARSASLDEDARATWEAAGYLSGLADGRGEREPVGTFGHQA